MIAGNSSPASAESSLCPTVCGGNRTVDARPSRQRLGASAGVARQTAACTRSQGLGKSKASRCIFSPMSSATLRACSAAGKMGVVGVSCVLTNWHGGWQLKAAGVPVQGVLLDYAGCRRHWDEYGLSTDVNLSKLRKVVGRAFNSVGNGCVDHYGQVANTQH